MQLGTSQFPRPVTPQTPAPSQSPTPTPSPNPAPATGPHAPPHDHGPDAHAQGRSRPTVLPSKPFVIPPGSSARNAPNTAGSIIDPGSSGPANLAVAWWPQDISFIRTGTEAELRFQTTVANMGGAPTELKPGDRVEYVVERSNARGARGEVVGRGSAPLTEAEETAYPPPLGEEIGRPISSAGERLAPVAKLDPERAVIIGSKHDSQLVRLSDVREGFYALRQSIVRADGSTDANTFDDVRVTEFHLDSRGVWLHTGSRYDGR